jgi:2,3-bisphosphoglycerate-independent phosphoglycerate mutase
LFGYDPVDCNVGRGILEAVGIDFNLQPEDLAARGNFCTVDKAGLVTNRRAGRISTEKCAELCRLLDNSVIENIRIIVRPVREYRFIAVFRGDGLSPEATDSDPQQLGEAPPEITALSSAAEKMADVANRFVAQAKAILFQQYPANMVLLRGFSRHPQLPDMSEIYKLKPAAIAGYPMYRGLARLVGMDVLETGITIEEEFRTLTESYSDYDFFFLHVKGTDAAGEDGDFDLKVNIIEQVDNALPELINLQPDVIIVTGDHSTPALFQGHSWHPVPLLLSSRWCRPDRVTTFSESACISGGLGHLPATQIMPLAMANALKLTKFGA